MMLPLKEATMPSRRAVFAAFLGGLVCVAARAADSGETSKTYKALKHTPSSSSATWAILDRDGANRPVERYLSSLGGGESGTGVIHSPPFRLAADTVSFTICGHDGPQGGQKKNFIALVDVKTGKILKQTMAPSADAMQERSWDVKALRGRSVRLEIHDGDSGAAFAWMGIGRIDAGDALRVDFRRNLPEGWIAKARQEKQPSEVVCGGIAFLRYPAEYSMVPNQGPLEIPCGFAAERLFVLGCTVPGGKPVAVYGVIEIVYRDGASEEIPLMLGYTLDVSGKLLSKSPAIHLHPSADPFQHYLVVATRPEVIEKIILRRNPEHEEIPRITAITCQTPAQSPNLQTLPDAAPGPDEQTWIGTHAITPASPDIDQVMTEIRRANKM
jgi:hypothetical protein